LQAVFAALFSTTGPNPTPVAPTPEATPALAPTPTPVPASQNIALANPHLIRLKSDGSTVELLPESVLHPAWSPDGNWIAYSSAREGTLDLYRIPASGGAVQRLTDLPARETHPAWLPYGERLIFASDLDGVSALYLLDILSNITQPMIGLPLPASWPAVSPDGRKLAFSAAPDGDWDLYTIDLDVDSRPAPGTLTRLTTSIGSDISPDWNLDGTTLVYASSRSGSLDLYLLTLSDLSMTSLTNSPANEWAPRWLNEGRLVYQTYDGEALTAWLMDPESGISFPVDSNLKLGAWPVPQP
jgi:Tol biopolymer transport system component